MPETSLPVGQLLVVVAHPDESFGCGSTIAHAVAAGSRVSVCCATLGEAGELAPGYDLGDRTLAEVRHAELHAAAAALGATCLPPLGLLDSGFDGPIAAGTLCALPLPDLAARIGKLIVATRPDVVLTIADDDGHRDHLHLAAAIRAATAASGLPLYEWCLPNHLMRRWQRTRPRPRPTRGCRTNWPRHSSPANT